MDSIGPWANWADREQVEKVIQHLVGLRADVRLSVFKPWDGAVAKAAHHRHQRVEVL